VEIQTCQFVPPGATAEQKRAHRDGTLDNDGGVWLAGPEPLAVSPALAWRLLGVCNSTGYKLLAAGELDSFLVGRCRRVTMASIKGLIARRIEAERAA